MKIIDNIKKLCKPAYIYLVISVFGIIMSILQNIGNTNMYCIGNFSCKVGSTPLLFLSKLGYISLWTIILDSLCKAGYKDLSWFLVLIPFILFFILIGLLLINQGVIHV